MPAQCQRPGAQANGYIALERGASRRGQVEVLGHTRTFSDKGQQALWASWRHSGILGWAVAVQVPGMNRTCCDKVGVHVSVSLPRKAEGHAGSARFQLFSHLCLEPASKLTCIDSACRCRCMHVRSLSAAAPVQLCTLLYSGVSLPGWSCPVQVKEVRVPKSATCLAASKSTVPEATMRETGPGKAETWASFRTRKSSTAMEGVLIRRCRSTPLRKAGHSRRSQTTLNLGSL